MIVLACANFWHHLLSTIVFIDDNKDNKCDFEGFCVSEKEAIFSELLEYAKTRNESLDRAHLEEMISIDDNVPIIELMSNSEQIESVTQNSEILNFHNLIQKPLKMIKIFPLKI